MRTGWIVNLLLVLGVGALAFYALYKPKQEAAGPQHAISTLAPSAVKRVRVEPQSGTSLELQKEGEGWFLVQPLRARADRIQVERLLDLLKARSKEQLAATELQRFDLDQPALRVRFDDHTIAFGTTNPLSSDQYVLSGSSVFLLPAFYRAQVPDRPERVLTHALFRPGEKPTAFRFRTFSVEQRDGKWQVLPATGKEAPSQDDFNRWVDDWKLASSLLTQPVREKTAAPESVEVALAGGGKLTLGIVQRSPQLILLRSDEKLLFHFSEELRDRLLTAPAVPESSAAASGTAPAPAAASGTAPAPAR
jgi:hypothetical protein